jgi:hypothetical protein
VSETPWALVLLLWFISYLGFGGVSPFWPYPRALTCGTPWQKE